VFHVSLLFCMPDLFGSIGVASALATMVVNMFLLLGGFVELFFFYDHRHRPDAHLYLTSFALLMTPNLAKVYGITPGSIVIIWLASCSPWVSSALLLSTPSTQRMFPTSTVPPPPESAWRSDRIGTAFGTFHVAHPRMSARVHTFKLVAAGVVDGRLWISASWRRKLEA